MIILFLILSFVVLLTAKPQLEFAEANNLYGNGSLLDQLEDAKFSVPQLIEKYGYPVEVHAVTTKDNYILTVHRIPYGKKCGPGNGKRVVLLQHGLLSDSSIWVLTKPEKGLAYNLADECYDVWMGNFRGNVYSKNHTKLSPIRNKNQFWDFSWHEMGIYDLPAIVDYALARTGAKSIYYVGYSMSTTAFWVFLSERPEYNSKIKLMCALAPVAYMAHSKSPLVLLGGPVVANFDWMINLLGNGEILPSNKLMQYLGFAACHQKSPIREICSNLFFLSAGFDSEQLDPGLVPVFMGHLPAGSSVRSVIHYAQLVYSKQFRQYDFRFGNMQKYGSLTPPEYKLERITVPVALFWGDNDWLADQRDVARIAQRLKNLKLNYRVKYNKYNHLDFAIAKDNIELLNKPLIEFMRNF